MKDTLKKLIPWMERCMDELGPESFNVNMYNKKIFYKLHSNNYIDIHRVRPPSLGFRKHC